VGLRCTFYPPYLEARDTLTIMLKKMIHRLPLLRDQSGQDLIEYALVVALIAFAATAGMTQVATKINDAFIKIGTTLSTYIS
jgi:pilus assembly protein Flp/PilA